MAITHNISQHVAQANQENDSPTQISIPSGLDFVQIRLTSSQWNNAALAGKRVLWGVQLSRDGGVNWGPGFCDNEFSNQIGGASLSVPAWAYTTVIIGTLIKDGGLPFMSFSLDDLTAAQGTTARLFAWPESDISLGASVTVSFQGQ